MTHKLLLTLAVIGGILYFAGFLMLINWVFTEYDGKRAVLKAIVALFWIAAPMLLAIWFAP